MNISPLFLLAITGVFSVTSCSSESASKSTPTVTTSAGSTADSTVSHPNAVIYSCPMDPEVTSTQPGKKCSKCGMNLEKKS